MQEISEEISRRKLEQPDPAVAQILKSVSGGGREGEATSNNNIPVDEREKRIERLLEQIELLKNGLLKVQVRY